MLKALATTWTRMAQMMFLSPTGSYKNGAGFSILSHHPLAEVAALLEVSGDITHGATWINIQTGYTQLVERSGSILQMNEALNVCLPKDPFKIILTKYFNRPLLFSTPFPRLRKMAKAKQSVCWILCTYGILHLRNCSAFFTSTFRDIIPIPRFLSGQKGFQLRRNIAWLATASMCK